MPLSAYAAALANDNAEAHGSTSTSCRTRAAVLLFELSGRTSRSRGDGDGDGDGDGGLQLASAAEAEAKENRNAVQERRSKRQLIHALSAAASLRGALELGAPGSVSFERMARMVSEGADAPPTSPLHHPTATTPHHPTNHPTTPHAPAQGGRDQVFGRGGDRVGRVRSAREAAAAS